jgi:trehalose utilization protein
MKIRFLPLSTILTLLCTQTSVTYAAPVRVLIWDEQQPTQKKAYGDRFLGETIADHLAKNSDFSVNTATLDDPEQGLSDETLDQTDVLIMWSHVRNGQQHPTKAESIMRRVRDGKLGFLPIHSAHWCKPFVSIMQERSKEDARKLIPQTERQNATLETLNDRPWGRVPKATDRVTPFLEKTSEGKWSLTLPSCVFPTYRADGAPGHVTTLLPDHPIAKGLPLTWDVNQTEMYGEPFHVPEPDAVVFEERWDKGERFRSGCVWNFGKGRVFYFRPGHETFPVFRQSEPLTVLQNACKWLATSPNTPR